MMKQYFVLQIIKNIRILQQVDNNIYQFFYK